MGVGDQVLVGPLDLEKLKQPRLNPPHLVYCKLVASKVASVFLLLLLLPVPAP